MDGAPIELVFVGTGEAFDPQRGNNSLWVRGSTQVLVDCGFAAVERLWRAGVEPDDLDVVYLTHQHADHTFGLPALVLWMRLGGRRRPLVVAGGPGTARWARAILDLGYPGSLVDAPDCFPIAVREVEPGTVFACGTARLRCAPSAHSVDNYAVRVDIDGVVVAASGDGAPTPATTALFRDAHALVHECYWADGEPRHGHATWPAVLDAARRARVRQLFLVHVGLGERQALADAVSRHDGRPPVLVPAPGDRFRLRP